MTDLFPIRRDDDDFFGKVKKYTKKYFHPFNIATGMTFSAIGLGMTAAGVMYSDGINFAIENYSDLSKYLVEGKISEAVEYMRGSYRGSMDDALETGWKQVPLSYSIGHFVGGKIKNKVAKTFQERD